MPHTATALHELHLLFILLHNGSVRIGIAVHTNNKAVGERSHLIGITNARHGTARRDDVAEVREEVKDFCCRSGVGILLLNARNFICQAPVHIVGRLFKDIAMTVFHGILIHPNTSGEFITLEIV